jgi:hypothetical protein
MEAGDILIGMAVVFPSDVVGTVTDIRVSGNHNVALVTDMGTFHATFSQVIPTFPYADGRQFAGIR